MNKNRENQFYQITKKENIFEVLYLDKVIFTIECEDLIQFSTVLAAKQSNGMYSIYLPSHTFSKVSRYESHRCWHFEKDFICVLENVKEVYYYNKPGYPFNNGLLLVKVETGNDCGYWTAMDIDFFENHLTPERAKTRLDSLFKIPYAGVSEAIIIKEFDYLPLGAYLIKINNVIYCVNDHNSSCSVFSETMAMTLTTLGEVEVEPLLYDKWCFKVISKEGISFFTTRRSEESCNQIFGPFFNIERLDFDNGIFKKKLKTCYLAKNKNNEILGLFFTKCNDNHKIIFDSAIKETTFNQLANWFLEVIL